MQHVVLEASAEEHPFPAMLAELLTQNLQTHPHKWRDVARMFGRVAIVADDALVEATLVFDGRDIRVFAGVCGAPDVTVRGSSEAIMAMNNVPLHGGWPVPDPRSESEREAFGAVVEASRVGAVHTLGLLLHPVLVFRLTRVMSVYA